MTTLVTAAKETTCVVQAFVRVQPVLPHGNHSALMPLHASRNRMTIACHMHLFYLKTMLEEALSPLSGHHAKCCVTRTKVFVGD